MTLGSSCGNSSNSSTSRVRTVVRSSPAVRSHQRDQPVEGLDDSPVRPRRQRRRTRRRCRRARRRRRRRRPPAEPSRAAGTRSDGARPWPRHDWAARPGSPGRRRAHRRIRRRPTATAPARARDRPPRRPRISPPSSLPAVALSSESTQRRSCSGGCTPSKLEIGWPPATATTVGTACTPNTCATRGAVSTLTVVERPLAAVGIRQRREHVAQLCAGLAARRPQQDDDGHLVGPGEHLGFEVRLGDVETDWGRARGGIPGRWWLLECREVERAGQRGADGRSWTCHADKFVTSFRRPTERPRRPRPARWCDPSAQPI